MSKRKTRRTTPAPRGKNEGESLLTETSSLVAVSYGIPVWLVIPLLMAATIAIYWSAVGCDFVNYDDPDYVTSNLHVQNGLGLAGIKWAFCNPVAANWHPLTILSHMMDCQLFGLRPWGHHLTNVLLHACNTALVFLLLCRLTGKQWRSFFVAALFGWHPLHVESVAWVAERKDVLSGCFGLLSLIFYAAYAQKRSSAGVCLSERNTFPARLDYWLAFFFLALGLMSKAMLVTWPFVMLLLDYWPLDRFQAGNIWRLIKEKIPFIAVALLASVVTLVVQMHSGAVQTIDRLPFAERIGNALISYGRYLGKLFWPVDLAVFYPYSRYWPTGMVLLACGLLLGFSMLLWRQKGRHPFLLMGWLWYLGTLVPVIGVVQVGSQAMADRYMYLPSLGLLILFVWGAYELTRSWRQQSMVLTLVGAAAIIPCIGATRHQTAFWQNSEVLFRHAIKVTDGNYVACNNLGVALDKEGRFDEGMENFHEAIRLKPNYVDAHFNLGVALYKKARIDEAITSLNEVVRLKPDYVNAHLDLGIALDKTGRLDEAISQFEDVLRLKPDFALAHYLLAVSLGKQGRAVEAIQHFQEAVRINPNDTKAHNDLGVTLAHQGQLEEAIRQFQEALRLNPNNAEAQKNLAQTIKSTGGKK